MWRSRRCCPATLEGPGGSRYPRFHNSVSVLGGWSSLCSIHQSWRRTEASPGNEKAISLAEKWLTIAKMACGFPTGLSFSTARRRGFITSATLGKPLTRESLVTHVWHLSTPMGSGLFAARTPRLPRILYSQGANSRPNTKLNPLAYSVNPKCRESAEKAKNVTAPAWEPVCASRRPILLTVPWRLRERTLR